MPARRAAVAAFRSVMSMTVQAFAATSTTWPTRRAPTGPPVTTGMSTAMPSALPRSIVMTFSKFETPALITRASTTG